MTDPKPPPGASSGADLERELERAVAEAEAAVSQVRGKVPTDAAPDDPAPDDDLRARVAQLVAEVEDLKDKRLRALADLENFKKRARREAEDAVLRRSQELLARLVPTVDNLERALEAAAAGADVSPEARLEQLIKGIEMVRDEFLKALAQEGITPVPSVGAPFDPQVHDALQQVDHPDHAPGTVVREFEKGFMHRERLLKPARVVVAGPGSGGADGQSNE